METIRFKSFHEAAEHVLRHLGGAVPRDAWLVARRDGEAWTTVAVDDRAFDLQPGETLQFRSALEAAIELRDRDRRIRFGEPDDPRTTPAVGSGPGIRTFVALPLAGRQGEVLGMLCCLDRRPPEMPDEASDALLALMAGLLGQLLEHELEAAALARTNERFRHEAMTDALTQLPNRRAWEQRLEIERGRLVEIGQAMFVSVVDLDSLKEVNDRDGHAAGDRLLRRAARVLDSTVRRTDFVARVGGDEFAVTGRPLGAIDAERISGRFREALAAADIRASVGTAIATAPSSLKDAWAEADRVMYRAKRQGGPPTRASA